MTKNSETLPAIDPTRQLRRRSLAADRESFDDLTPSLEGIAGTRANLA
jgi:hypothetical protein